MYKLSLLWLSLWLTLNALAQNSFAYKASLGEVKQDGFYKIPLPVSIIAKSQYYLEDIRLMDANATAVAYMIKQEEVAFVENSFINFPIIRKEKEQDKQTHIVIQNTSGLAINHLLLVTANMEAKRIVNISGSNDGKEWFVVKEGVTMDVFFNHNEVETIQSISLPTSNYAFFQLTILGKDVLPFNVIKAGIYKQNYQEAKYTGVPSPIIIQNDSTNKYSYIQLLFNDAYRVDKLALEIGSPKFFKRYVSVYLGNFASTKTPFTTVVSSNNTELFLNGLKAKIFLLAINNEDNAPLKINKVKAFQLNQFLLAYLEKGKQYHLAFGDSLAVKPQYDLTFFKDSIESNPTILTVGEIENQKIQQPVVVESKPSNKTFLWIAVALVSILLLFFTVKMMKEVNKRNRP